MPEPFAVDAGARYAFAPAPDPIDGVVHRIRILFKASDGRVWSTGTDMLVPSPDSAEHFCDALNARLGFDHDGWTNFAEGVFAAQAHLGEIT